MATREALHKATTENVRRWIMAIGGTAIISSGAILGALLREERDYNQKRERIREGGPELMIEHLETVRVDLVRRKTAVERQLNKHLEQKKEFEEQREAKKKALNKEPTQQASK